MDFGPEKMIALLERWQVPEFAPKRWVVAYSGGADSSALLHALASSRVKQVVCALHINHQLSPHSMGWQYQCADTCKQLGIAFFAAQIEVSVSGKGIEDAARQARYQAFEAFLQEGDCLLTAHHLDDQAETLLLRLMRGAGPRGLGAMRWWRNMGRGKLLRPLLTCTRAELHHYLLQQGVKWITDESNRDTHYDRNFLRHRVMPLLAQRWPDFAQRWVKTADLCRETDELNSILAAQDLAVLAQRSERLGRSVSLSPLRSWSAPRRFNVLRHWLEEQKMPLPEYAHLQQIDRQLIFARQDGEADVNWGDCVLRCFRDRLFCLSKQDVRLLNSNATVWPEKLTWSLSQPLTLPGGGVLAAQVDKEGEKRLQLSPVSEVEVRWRRGGERCRPQGRGHSQRLKKLLQEYDLEPWLRDRVPLIYSAGELAAVGDLWVCADFAARAGEPGVSLTWYIKYPPL